MKRIVYLLFISILYAILFTACKKEKDVEDYTIPIDGDGNKYATVKIGAQTWMVGALHTTKYNDGTTIEYDSEWIRSDSKPVYCYYNNEPDSATTYGCLYNWHAVNSGKLAPKGWHIATRADWETLIKYYGGEFQAASALRDYYGWNPCECDSARINDPFDDYICGCDRVYNTSESELNLLPVGCREVYFDGQEEIKFSHIGYRGYWWTSTAALGAGAYYVVITNSDNSASMMSSALNSGFAVVCVKD